MNKGQVISAINWAVQQLCTNDAHLAVASVYENTINARLACYLDKYLHDNNLVEGRVVDVEYNRHRYRDKEIPVAQAVWQGLGKNAHEDIRPDIIIHTRTPEDQLEEDNLLVVEVKRSSHELEEYEWALCKLSVMTDKTLEEQECCGYDFGICLAFRGSADGFTAWAGTWIENGRQIAAAGLDRIQQLSTSTTWLAEMLHTEIHSLEELLS